MALDGLSNQNVGIYRTKSSSERNEKLAARSKEKAQIQLSDVEETVLVKSIDADGHNKEDKQQNKEEILSEAKHLLTDEKEKEVLQLVVEDENSPVELEYTLKFNSDTKMIEMNNVKNGELVETVSPEELMKILYKAKSISGIFIDKKI